jgi:enamine deaminase RidA (YjgF/YER057c/UK114 family)
MNRQNISSDTGWERIVGYSRAVRIGTQVWVSGTTSTGSRGQVVKIGDAYGQTRQALKNIESALKRVGANLSHVVRTRIFLVDMTEHWQDVGRAHGEVFGAIRPTTSIVEVRALVDPRMLVEIEADAVVSD